MFPINLSSKRAQLALRFFTYGVMTLATITLTSLAIFYALGYRFNQSTLSFEQGGLMQFRSTPSGASVSVDGKMQDFSTPGRVNLPAGTHTVVMQRDGYRDWQRSVSLGPGELLWLNYVRLVPQTVSTSPLKNFASLSSVLVSPDHRWLLLQEAPNSLQFTLADIGDERKPVFTTLALPDAQFSRHNGSLGAITMAEWDTGSRYILLRHTYGNSIEWLRVDRQNPAETINISRRFSMNIGDAHFALAGANILYAKTDDVLRRLDVASNSASAALATGVRHFTLGPEDSAAYIAVRDGQQVIGIYTRDKDTLVQTHGPDVPLKITYAEFDSHAYLAINKDDGKLQVLRDPGTAAAKDTAEFASVQVGQSLTQLSTSKNGRMIVAVASGSLTTFDIELGRSYSSNLAFLSGAPSRPLAWLDDYYLYSDVGDRLQIFEFDGLNSRDITAVAGGFAASLSATGHTLFTVIKTADGFALQASQLVKP